MNKIPSLYTMNTPVQSAVQLPLCIVLVVLPKQENVPGVPRHGVPGMVQAIGYRRPRNPTASNSNYKEGSLSLIPHLSPSILGVKYAFFMLMSAGRSAQLRKASTKRRNRGRIGPVCCDDAAVVLLRAGQGFQLDTVWITQEGASIIEQEHKKFKPFNIFSFLRLCHVRAANTGIIRGSACRMPPHFCSGIVVGGSTHTARSSPAATVLWA